MAAKNISAKEFYELLKGSKPVLVDFWAPWCGYCRRIEPVYERIGAEYAEKLEVVKVNTDESPALAQSEQIEVIPTLVLYAGGKYAGSIVAPESAAMIREFIEKTVV